MKRSQEIGIRKTLGAGKEDVLRLIVADGMKLALIGLAIGLVWRVSTSTSVRQPVPSLPHCRRMDFYSRLRRGRWRRTGLLHPRAAGDAGRSHGGAALRVVAPSTPERALNLA
jgi:hypothetical protein